MPTPDMNLEQLLADPLVRLVMSSDAVQENDIRRLACVTRRRLRTRGRLADDRRSDAGASAYA